MKISIPLLLCSCVSVFSVTLSGAESPRPAGAVAKAPANPAAAPAEWRSLLDDNLSAWEIWMGSPHVSVTGLPEGTVTSANGTSGEPLGLNNDPKKVFSVRREGGEPVLVITGEIYGAVSSKESFSNYHFRTQFKWGDRKWEPRLTKPRDNGILYHCTGPHGAFWKVWKRCLEYQVQEKDMGDLHFLAGTSVIITAAQTGNTWSYDLAGEVKKAGGVRGSIGGRVAHRAGEFEKPHGEWNTLEFYTLGRTAVHLVNGEVVLVLTNAANVDGPEQRETPLDAGGIQIQSEAAEAYYRRIEIRPITALPDSIKRAANL